MATKAKTQSKRSKATPPANVEPKPPKEIPLKTEKDIAPASFQRGTAILWIEEDTTLFGIDFEHGEVVAVAVLPEEEVRLHPPVPHHHPFQSNVHYDPSPVCDFETLVAVSPRGLSDILGSGAFSLLATLPWMHFEVDLATNGQDPVLRCDDNVFPYGAQLTGQDFSFDVELNAYEHRPLFQASQIRTFIHPVTGKRSFSRYYGLILPAKSFLDRANEIVAYSGAPVKHLSVKGCYELATAVLLVRKFASYWRNNHTTSDFTAAFWTWLRKAERNLFKALHEAPPSMGDGEGNARINRIWDAEKTVFAWWVVSVRRQNNDPKWFPKKKEIRSFVTRWFVLGLKTVPDHDEEKCIATLFKIIGDDIDTLAQTP